MAHHITNKFWCGSEIDDGKGHIAVDTTLRRTSIFVATNMVNVPFPRGFKRTTCSRLASKSG